MIILDSSFIVAFHNTRDAHHEAAAEAMHRIASGEWGPVLLPEYVFLEVVTVLAARRDLATALRVGDALLRAEEVTFIPCTDVFAEAYEVFRSQSDGTLSFTDAAIVAIARQSGAEHLATFDRDFEGLETLALIPT